MLAGVPFAAQAEAGSAQTGSGAAAGPAASRGWFGTWSAAVGPPGTSGTSAEGLAHLTIRHVVRVSLGGDAVRVRFSNRYGERPLVLGAVTVAPRVGSSGPAVDPRVMRDVTFGGRKRVVVPAGQDVVSDPVGFALRAGSDLVVSAFLPKDTGPTTWHWYGLSTNYAASGNRVKSPGGGFAPFDQARYFLTGVSVRSSARGSVVFFGDSITDGNGAPLDADLRYPDQVASRLRERPADHQCGVLNQAIGGNRLLQPGLVPEAGESGVARFTRDISRPGVTSVVVLEGINDILTGGPELSADDLTAGYRSLIDQGHALGVAVFGGTLTPYEGYEGYTAAGEALRQQVNTWIRTSGEFDGVVDFDRAVRDPSRPTQLLPAYASPDQIHPNAAGYGAMAQAVDLDAVC